MREVVCDASVAVKWFVTEDEDGVASAHRLVAAHRDGQVAVVILDLTLYEVANALVRGRRLPPEDVMTVVEALEEICPVVVPEQRERRAAIQLAAQHGLTFYDASYAAVAGDRGSSLVTADHELIAAGLGEPVDRVAARLPGR